MRDERKSDLTDTAEQEQASVKAYQELMASKLKTLAKSIEEKMQRVPELSVEIEAMRSDVQDTQAAVADDKQFLAEVEGGCAAKGREWQQRANTRAEEMAAIKSTVATLSGSDALALFKKTFPAESGAPDFLQVRTANSAKRAGVAAHATAAAQIKRAQQHQSSHATGAGLD